MKTKCSFLRGYRTPVKILTCLLTFSGLSLLAHPGHPLNEAGLSHLLTSPNHLVVLALAGGAMSIASHFVQRRLPRRVLQGCGAFALASAIVILGIRS